MGVSLRCGVGVGSWVAVGRGGFVGVEVVLGGGSGVIVWAFVDVGKDVAVRYPEAEDDAVRDAVVGDVLVVVGEAAVSDGEMERLSVSVGHHDQTHPEVSVRRVRMRSPHTLLPHP